jgi:hypothetical protein
LTRYLKLASLAVVCAAVLAAPAMGAKGGKGGGVATIAFAGAQAAATVLPTGGSQVSFAVTANVKASDVDYLWVANICSLNGVPVSSEYHPVLNGTSGPFTLTPAGTQCNAYVWLFPDAWTALSGGTMTYSVS